MKYFRYKYFLFLLRLFILKTKYKQKIKIKSIYLGIEKNTQIIIKGKYANITFGKKNYLYRLGNLEVYENGKIIFGNNVSINKGFSIVARKMIKFGNDIMIGPNVMIYDHDHCYYKKNINFNKQGYKTSSISIGNNVWIGSNVFIAKGVKIGNNVVIAASSVITKDIPGNSLVAGNPFAIIKKLNE